MGAGEGDAMSEIMLKYKWRKTWPDRENDFVCVDDGVTVGRIYIHHMGAWVWFMNADEFVCSNGSADTPREAARCLEDAYDRRVSWYGVG
jgi:hypothetical protein